MDDRIRALQVEIEALKGGAKTWFTLLTLLESRYFYELVELLSAEFKIPFSYLPDEEDGREVWFGVLYPNSEAPQVIGVASDVKKSVAVDLCFAIIKEHTKG